MTKAMTTLLLIAILSYGAILLYMVMFERKLMYHPNAADVHPYAFGLDNFTEHTIGSEDGTALQLWYHEAKNNLPTIIYFHGNAGHLGDRAHLMKAFADKGMGVAAISYRGYGKSQGSPHELGIYADARASIKWVKSQGIALSNIAFYGESLGTGVAIKMATEYRPKALFLQAPYTSVADRAAEIYWYIPVKQLMRDKFDSISLIKDVRAPLTIFHGKLDPVIPYQHAESLMAEANEPKRAIYFDDIGHTEFDSAVIADHVLQALQ